MSCEPQEKAEAAASSEERNWMYSLSETWGSSAGQTTDYHSEADLHDALGVIIHRLGGTRKSDENRKTSWAKSPVVYQIKARALANQNGQGSFLVELRPWSPFGCAGSPAYHHSIQLKVKPPGGFLPGDIIWMRNTTTSNRGSIRQGGEKGLLVDTTKDNGVRMTPAKAVESLFRVILSFDLPCLQIGQSLLSSSPGTTKKKSRKSKQDENNTQQQMVRESFLRVLLDPQYCLPKIVEFDATCLDKQWSLEQAVAVCCRLLQQEEEEETVPADTSTTTSSSSIAWEGWDGCSSMSPKRRVHAQRQLDRLFVALQGNATLECLDFEASRYMNNWNKTSSRHADNIVPQDRRLSLVALVQALPTTHLKYLNLNGIVLESASVSLLGQALPHIASLSGISLRDTGLEEISMVDLFQGLSSEATAVLTLDISHNAVTPKVLKVITETLSCGDTKLERLTMDHCGLDLDAATLLASSLASFVNLRHLSLNGNPFTYEPLSRLQDMYCTPVGQFTNPDVVVSIGAKRLVDGLERNHTLLSLEMGEFGKVGSFAMVCCTEPSYHTLLDMDTKNVQNGFLSRNKARYDLSIRCQKQKAMVDLIAMLLAKMTPQQHTVDNEST